MAVLAQWLLLLSSPFCSAMAVSGYEDYWWTHPLEKFGLRPFIKHMWNGQQLARRPKDKSEDPEEPNVDFNLRRFRLTKRFDEAQIQEALTPANEERSRELWESLRRLLTDNFKLQARLKKRGETAGKEYITRLGKRSWIRGSIHRLANGWKPLKTTKRSSWGVWTSPAARHQMLFQSMKDRDAEQIMKKADKI